jgi:hypothetical protein
MRNFTQGSRRQISVAGRCDIAEDLNC